MVLNLVVNAAHAVADTGAGRGFIRVSTRIDAAQVVIDVADSGTGIPLPVADKVFEAFFTTKEVGAGAGQGLALCGSRVVDRHGGSIDFTTGTTRALAISGCRFSAPRASRRRRRTSG